MKAGRAYTQRARAVSAEQTRARILDAAVRSLRGHLRADVRLEDIAADAEVSVQTVLRVFGSKKDLLATALEQVLAEMAGELRQAEPGDVEGSVRAWFDHYERFGDIVVGNLADERDPTVRPIVAIGRERHREHVARQFGPFLGEGSERLLDALVCVCDVYTWKLLRRDMRRSRQAAEATMTLMINAVLGERR